MIANFQELQTKLRVTQRRMSRLRCEAFIDYTPVICGIELRPISLAIYNRLAAFESPFVCGGPVNLQALVDFCWCSHPLFSQTSQIERKRVLRRVYRHVHPHSTGWNGMLLVYCRFKRLRWLKRFTWPTPSERFVLATDEARRLVAEAMHDFPKSSDDGTAPAPIALQAQILNTFKRNLGLSYEETENMPLKRLVQLMRESMYASTGGKGLSLISHEEAELTREFLASEQQRINTSTNV